MAIQNCWYILITKEQKQPPSKLTSSCQTAEAGGLCACHHPPPMHGVIPVRAFFLDPASYPGQPRWPGLSWKALFCQLLPSLWSSQLSSSGNSSVDWLLLLTGVCGPYSHCHDLTKLSPDSARMCWGKNWVGFFNLIFSSSSISPWLLCPAQLLIPGKERLPPISSNVSS